MADNTSQSAVTSNRCVFNSRFYSLRLSN